MGALSTLVLKNNATDDVNFLVGGINYTNNVATWNADGSSYDARPTATFSLTLPTARTTRVRVKGKISIPVMDVVNPLMKRDELIANVEFVLPKSAGLADRQDLRSYLASLVTSTVISDAIDKYESVF